MASLPHHALVLLPGRAGAPRRRAQLPPAVWGRPPPPPRRRGGAAVARLSPGSFADLAAAEALARGLLERAEGVVYTVADAVVSSSPATEAVVEEGAKQSGDWLSGITNYLESVLKVLKDGLSALHVPYAYGFAIILLTILVKVATFPLTKKQVESALAMRSLQPQVKAVQERYAGDKERIQLETARLYKLAGVNPLAGCLPTLATIPVWIGLYRALSNVANEGLLTEGFFWIPSLAGPTTIAARQNGSGISWLFPFVDGHPPLGWSDTLAYLVLPALLVVSQYISTQIMQSSQGNDPNQNTSQALTRILPLMIGYFALSVPSGLSLYWFTNNVLSTAQQIWLQKLGGAKKPVNVYTDTIQGSLSNVSKSESKIGSSLLEDDSTGKVDSVTKVGSMENSSQGKQDSGGLRRGERFKQIKEQEARRRREREEARRRAEEAATAAHTKNEESGVNVYSENMLQVESSCFEVVEERSQSTTPVGDSSRIDLPEVNGRHAKKDSEEGKRGTHESGSSSDGLQQNVVTEGTKEGNS